MPAYPRSSRGRPRASLGFGIITGRGGSIWDNTSFDLPLGDAGAGAVSTTLSVGTGSATFTRATAASSKLANGLWKLDVASGVARSHYLGANTAVSSYGGYLSEGARTNLCLQSRDLSNASWTKVNATGTKDQIGIDGVGNSASSLTATLGGGSCLQTITEAATDSTLSMFIKRITGTGTVTIQQGATTSEISAQLNTSTYTQVSLDATVLNPSIGIVLGTNGDAIAVDCVQFENGAFASTPIPTTTVSVTRNADVLTYPLSGNALNTVGSAYAELSLLGAVGASQVAISIGDTTGQPLVATAITTIAIFDGTNAPTKTVASYATAVRKAASSWGGGLRVTGDGLAPATSAFDGAMGVAGNIRIGGTATAASELFGSIKNVRIWTQELSNATLQLITA